MKHTLGEHVIQSFHVVFRRLTMQYLCKKKYLQTKEINYFQGVNEERDLEMAVVKLLDFKVIIVCIYRSLVGNFHIFLSSLELVIQKLGAHGAVG
jgi:hypothetical protein